MYFMAGKVVDQGGTSLLGLRICWTMASVSYMRLLSLQD
ncbi:hypothetical protein OH686_09125 [Pseudomonas sp. SO81]|nr:hypothetical protein OH686_09125 [Pseudomonas sp. SO81]